jgi:hypothetical protein
LTSFAHAGFTSSNFATGTSFNYDQPATATINVSYQLSAAPGQQQLYVKDDVLPAQEDASQKIKLYLDSSLTQAAFGQVIDLKPTADGSVHTISLYGKLTISKAGDFSFVAPIYIMDNGAETSANVTVSAHALAICQFQQPSYNVSKSASPNQVIEAPVSVTYKCSYGLTPTLTTSMTSYASNEDSHITAGLFQGAGGSLNLASNALTLTANDVTNTANLFVKLFEDGNSIITKTGTFTTSIPIAINF